MADAMRWLVRRMDMGKQWRGAHPWTDTRDLMGALSWHRCPLTLHYWIAEASLVGLRIRRARRDRAYKAFRAKVGR